MLWPLPWFLSEVGPLARISHSRPERGRNALPEQRKRSFAVDTLFAKITTTQRPKFRQIRRLLVPAYKRVRNAGYSVAKFTRSTP